jgi:hypothetical protein
VVVVVFVCVFVLVVFLFVNLGLCGVESVCVGLRCFILSVGLCEQSEVMVIISTAW